MTTKAGRGRRRLVGTLAAAALGLAAAGCGGGDETSGGATTETPPATETTEETTPSTPETTGEGTVPVGRTVFVDSCGSCHTLEDAGTSGSVGPKLDGLGLSKDAVETQVRNGGGAMPAFEGQLSEEQIDEVAAYVAAASS